MNSIKNKLNSGKPVIGTWVTLGHTGIVEIAANSGMDFITVDMEHSTISIETAGELIRCADLAGSTPLVRLSSNDPVQIKRVMDAGARGIIVPNTNSATDARNAAKAMLYPPAGNRGVGLARAQGYGPGFSNYMESLKDRVVLIPQIEHIDGVNNLEEILAVPEVDGIMIGPYDLSASLGTPGEFNTPGFLECIERIEAVTKAHNKALGLHVVEPDTEKLSDCLTKGYTFLAYTLDIRTLDLGFRHGVEAFKKATERS